MEIGRDAAAICGLFCATCPSYPRQCGGCLSERVAPGCDSCTSGFRECAKARGVLRCHECGEFPCERLEDFSQRHVINGICHHANVIEDLRRMGEAGVDAWVEEQTQAHTCPHCKKLIVWYERACPRCD